MRIKIKLFIRLLILSILYWIAAMLMFIMIRYNGLEEEMSMFVSEPLDLPLDVYFSSVLVLGTIFGITYTFVELFFVSLLKQLTPGLSIILKSIIYFFLIILLLSVLTLYLEEQFDINITDEIVWWHEEGLFWWFKDKLFWNIIIYFIIMSIILSLLRIAYDKFGRGMFFNMLIGKYRKPQEEERILMFLDLKDSTTIAEHLGHQLYSKFIQDCFKDLNSVISKYEAEVYQYVGDEAVLSWTSKKGFRKNNSVNLFFAFQKRLEKRAEKYQKLYNYAPKFKAGLHCGKLMISEVGTIKKEIAYHGDVINTAARIQSLCNTYNASLLVSETLLNRSTITLKYNAEFVDEFVLRGKEKNTSIYKITEKE